MKDHEGIEFSKCEKDDHTVYKLIAREDQRKEIEKFLYENKAIEKRWKL